MPLNRPFQSQSNAIATYAYTDLAEGTGVSSFFLAQEKDPTPDQILTGNQIYSSIIEQNGDATGETAFTLLQDLDFDLTSFNTPRIIEGTGYLNIGLMVHTTSGTAVGYIIAKLRHWDGTTETDIVSVTSNEVTGTGGANNHGYEQLALPLVIPLTNFKIGATLRLTIELWGKTSAGTPHHLFGTDPKSSDSEYMSGSDIDTTSTLYIPFRLLEV